MLEILFNCSKAEFLCVFISANFHIVKSSYKQEAINVKELLGSLFLNRDLSVKPLAYALFEITYLYVVKIIVLMVSVEISSIFHCSYKDFSAVEILIVLLITYFIGIYYRLQKSVLTLTSPVNVLICNSLSHSLGLLLSLYEYIPSVPVLCSPFPSFSIWSC